MVRTLSSLVDIIRTDLTKVVRYAAVSAVTVPMGMALLFVFLEVVDMRPVLANVTAVSIATLPNYVLNRYWVWNKRGANSMRREVAPFWIMALVGGFLSSLFIWIAEGYTDQSLVFLAVNFIAFGIVWVLKFFVIEKYLFGPPPEPVLHETTV